MPGLLNANDYMRLIYVMSYDLEVKKQPWVTVKRLTEITLISKKQVIRRLNQLIAWGVVTQLPVEHPNQPFRYVLNPRTAWADQRA